MARKLIFSLVAFTLLTVSQVDAQQDYADFGSQQYVPFGPAGTPDWQWFAPVSAEKLSEKPYQGDGYFFSYEYLNWWLSKSDRAMIGSSANAFSDGLYSHAYPFQMTDTGVRVLDPSFPGGTSLTLANSVMTADPMTREGNGNRFEFGFVEDRWGWMVSVIDGVEFNNSQFYGIDGKRVEQINATQGTQGAPGFFTNQILQIDGQLVLIPEEPAVPGTVGILAIDGLLTGHIFFDDPFNTLSGFVDTVNNVDGTLGADGIADDLNGNGIVDDGDRVPYAPAFDDITVRHATELTSVEVTGIRRKRTTYHGAAVDGFLGVRYIEFDDRMNVLARGGILGDTSFNNQALNRLVGPQIGFHYHKRSGRWDFGMQARGMFAANFVSQRLNGDIADHLPAGVVNTPNVAPTSYNATRHDELFSPVGEFRAEASVLLTSKVAFKFGWNGLIMGGLTRAANTIQYSLPKPGLRGGKEEAFAQGVSVGFEINR